MLIALDYDDTFTECPELWLSFIETARKHDHEVICVTLRYPSEIATMNAEFRSAVEIFCTCRTAKAPFMAELGIKPNVWITEIKEVLAPEGEARPGYNKEETNIVQS